MHILRMAALTLATLMASGAALAQARIADLGWLTGAWVQATPDETVQESWVGPQGNTMVGVGLTHSAKRGASFEFMRIVEGADGLAFWGSPAGRPAEEFKLKESGAQRVVFENPAKEFPQRVMYWREGALLKARIEGTVQGRARGIDWSYQRAP
jgi:hypothetical protein